MTFLVGRELLEQQLRHAVVDRIAIGRSFEVKRARLDFGGEVAAQNLFDVLADPQGIEHLHIREAVEEQDAIGEAVGVMHLLDRFLAPFLREVLVAPIVEDAVMQPILVDGGEFAAQPAIEIFDDLGVSAHVRSLSA